MSTARDLRRESQGAWAREDIPRLMLRAARELEEACALLDHLRAQHPEVLAAYLKAMDNTTS